jgi:excinuclease UvrABC helicase subunit UvrB
MIQSEYYETTNTTPQELSKKAPEEIDSANKQKGSKIKSSSSTKELKRDSILRPKVSKNVFSPRHRISKQLSLSPKKGLLFTFGI